MPFENTSLRRKKDEEKLWTGTLDSMKIRNTWVFGIQEEPEDVKGIESIFSEIKTENFQNPKKDKSIIRNNKDHQRNSDPPSVSSDILPLKLSPHSEWMLDAIFLQSLSQPPLV